MGSTITVLLDMLGDGQWHNLAELQRQARLAGYKVQSVAAFLCRFDFAVIDETNEKVKVSRDFQDFLTRT